MNFFKQLILAQLSSDTYDIYDEDDDDVPLMYTNTWKVDENGNGKPIYSTFLFIVYICLFTLYFFSYLFLYEFYKIFYFFSVIFFILLIKSSRYTLIWWNLSSVLYSFLLLFFSCYIIRFLFLIVVVVADFTRSVTK